MDQTLIEAIQPESFPGKLVFSLFFWSCRYVLCVLRVFLLPERRLVREYSRWSWCERQAFFRWESAVLLNHVPVQDHNQTKDSNRVDAIVVAGEASDDVSLDAS